MNKKEIVKTLKNEFNSKLEKKVLNIILNDINNNNYDGDFITKLDYILSYYTSHGCNSGIVSELVYYTDTTRWFDTYKKEIINIINDLIFNHCFNIDYDYEKSYSYITINNEYFKIINNRIATKKFDIYQKNSLAWLSFEDIAYRIYNYFNENIKEA